MQKIKYRFVSNEKVELIQLADWLKSNLTLPINKRCLKYIVETINHENLHSIIYNFFNVKNEPRLLLKSTGKYYLEIGGVTHAEYEVSFILKFVFVEFVQMIVDVIHDVFTRRNFFFRIKFYIWKILGKVESEYEAKKRLKIE